MFKEKNNEMHNTYTFFRTMISERTLQCMRTEFLFIPSICSRLQ